MTEINFSIGWFGSGTHMDVDSWFDICSTVDIRNDPVEYFRLSFILYSHSHCCLLSQANYPFIIKSGKPTVEMTIDELNILEEATSMRQCAEWGRRAFQSSFPRVKDRISFEYRGQWKLMMKLLILLYNLRTKRVGISQILNVYMPSPTENVNELYVNAA